MFNIPIKTRDQTLREVIENLSVLGDSAITSLAIQHKTNFDNFWNNPEATPMEICEALGNEAYKLFTNSQATQAFIKSMRPEYEPFTIPERYEVTFGKDGTVQIVDKL